MELDLESTDADFRQQLILLLSDNLDESLQLVGELRRDALRGHPLRMGSKASPTDNLRLAIQASIAYLAGKGMPLEHELIISNLWVANNGLNEFQYLILEINKGDTDAESTVIWVDRRGREQSTSYRSLKKRVNREKNRN